MKKNEPVKASPRRLLMMFTFAVFGLCISAYLTLGYLQVADLACTDTGCDTIRAWHDKRLPRALLPGLGSLYFLALTALSVMMGYADEKRVKGLSTLAMIMGALGAVAVTALTWIEHSLSAYCFWCLMVAGTAWIFFILSVLEWRSWKRDHPRYELDFEPYLKWGWVPVAVLFLLISSMDQTHGTLSDTQGDPGQNAAGNTAGSTSTASAGGNTTPTSNPGTSTEDLLKQVQLVRPDSHFKGPEDAPFTIVEFADPGCHACASQAPVLDELTKRFPKEVKVVYRHFPLKSHPNSPLAAEAMEAAGAQGKFWQMQEILFQNYHNQTEPDIMKYAQQIELDMKRFASDLKSHRYAAKVQQDRADGDRIGVRRTPTMIINNKQIFTGPMTVEYLQDMVKNHLKGTTASGQS